MASDGCGRTLQVAGAAGVGDVPEWTSGPLRLRLPRSAVREAIEVDEYEAHAEADPFAGDRWRDADCALAGWFVLRIPDFDIYNRPAAVLGMIEAHLDRLSRRLG